MQFSVIIPLYNKAAYIRATLESVLAQTCQDFEIIVVDDGSRDGSADVVQALRDPRIRLLRQANGGVSRARNAGIALARGELVCFLDADDWFGPDYLATLAAMAARHPAGVFYATAYQRVRDGDAAPPLALGPAVPQFSRLENFYAHRYRHGMFFFTSSVAIPRQLLNEMQPCFPEGEQFGEDQDLWFRVAERCALVYCPARLVAYRIGLGDSLSDLHSLRTMPAAFVRLEARARAGTVPAPMRAAALQLVAHTHLMVARFALLEGRRGDAWRGLRAAARDGRSRKWWVTALLSLLGSGALVRHWEVWRARRSAARQAPLR